MYELGQREPDFETLESFADWFNVDVDYLLGKKDQYSGYSLEEKQLIFMYRKASEDDRAIIKSALSKYGCIK